ncbi:MAG: prepilin-type N-terminal cleavage/methylation domain-containing protein [Planctomycetes bacterium]|nr:prepilin-type N-terminal cleavage/methylation domain-containing protein [Planctomycetota bacterium]
MRRAGFTLIEVMMAVAIAMAMVALASGVVFQIRKMSDRASARLAMSRSSALVHGQLAQRIAAAAPGQAMVLEWRAGRMRLLFMRGVVDVNDWEYSRDAGNNDNNADFGFWSTFSSDLVWELWEWSRADHVLRSATTRNQRSFRLRGESVGGISYGDHFFAALPQPRRTLQAATWRDELNGNLLFPDYSRAATDRLAGRRGLVPGDVGDWTELSDRLVPVLSGSSSDRQVAADPSTWDGVVDFAIRIETVDGTVHEMTQESVDSTIVIQGTRCDGVSTGIADATVPGRRSALLKLCWTLRDRRSGLSMPYSYSLPFPALAGGQ